MRRMEKVEIYFLGKVVAKEWHCKHGEYIR
jgi:hypothetical protein